MSSAQRADLTTPTNRKATGSPAADCAPQLEPATDPIILEDEQISVGFDRSTGALIELIDKRTGWKVLGQPERGQSFRAFLSQPKSLYNIALGSQSRLENLELAEYDRAIRFTWVHLGTQKFAIEFLGSVTLANGQLEFSGQIRNQSAYRLDTISWPYLGHLDLPVGSTGLTRENLDYGTLQQTPLYPRMKNEKGYFGTNYPIQLEGKGPHAAAGTGGIHLLQRFVLLNAGSQGIYLGVHEENAEQMVCFISELRPGWTESIFGAVPMSGKMGEHPVALTLEATHYPFVNPGETLELGRVTMAFYQGDWTAGLAPLKRWREKSFRTVTNPDWLNEVHAWQQLQIGSAEDDLRTRFVDLPARVAALPKNRVSALQLVGWNDGGQDRGNPSHDPDPRLGTWQELRDAIAKIEKSGVHVILFNKYVWADATRPDYLEMAPSMAQDPNGLTYFHPGWEYQTPVQLMSINTRRLAIACLHDPGWVDRCLCEFQKSVDLGATGILYDEAFHHWSATHCFAPSHGHRVPATLWSADFDFGLRLRQLVDKKLGAEKFLLAAEAPYDLQQQHYGLSYFRIGPDHIPAERYLNPYYPIMVAVTGFDDREMLNRALLYRYIISYEPFNFKGDLTDYPATLAYGCKVDDLRRRYADYVWDAVYEHHRGARVQPKEGDVAFAIFQNEKAKKRALVILNDSAHSESQVSVELDPPGRSLRLVSPEDPEPRVTDGTRIKVPPRSAIVILEN